MKSVKLLDEWMRAGNLSIPSILMCNYVKIGLSDAEFVCLLHIFEAVEKGNKYPKPEDIHCFMNYSLEQCETLVRSLLHKRIIKIEEEHSQEGNMIKIYSFSPLWEKLTHLLLSPGKKNITTAETTSIYSVFEREFGRPLSPMECETLSIWIEQDKQPEQIIKHALREAIIAGKLNFRYIDRILFDWKKNKISTLEEAQEYSKRFRTYQKTPKPKSENTNVERTITPLYNWLEK